MSDANYQNMATFWLAVEWSQARAIANDLTRPRTEWTAAAERKVAIEAEFDRRDGILRAWTKFMGSTPSHEESGQP